MSLKDIISNQLHSDLVPGRDYFESPDVYEKEILAGVRWDKTAYGIASLDTYCPYKQGQLTCVIGHTTVGKTTLILYLLSRLLRERKLIIYSAENRISQMARMIISFFWASRMYKDYFNWLRERVLFIRHAKQFTYKDMLEQIAISDDMGFNADCILIDPYNALKIDRKAGGNSHEYHYEAIEDMRIFTMQTRKSIFVNCHTVTDAQRVKPNEFGEIPPPIMSDVEGGAKFPNKADDVWVIHRHLYAVNEIERYVSMLYVGKVRNTEGGGKPTGWKSPLKFKFRSDWTGFDEQGDSSPMPLDQRLPYSN